MADQPPKFPRPGALPTIKETLPSMTATDPRRDSIGALDENDRALMTRVLRTAQQALSDGEARAAEMQAALVAEQTERAKLEGKMVSRFSDYDLQIGNIREDVSELRGLRGDISGLRGDISGLTSAVTSNLAEDARRERDHAALVIKVEALAHDVGRDAGKKAGGRWGFLGGISGPIAIAFVIWVISAIAAVARGKDLPPIPVLGTASPTQPAPQTTAH